MPLRTNALGRIEVTPSVVLGCFIVDLPIRPVGKGAKTLKNFISQIRINLKTGVEHFFLRGNRFISGTLYLKDCGIYFSDNKMKIDIQGLL